MLRYVVRFAEQSLSVALQDGESQGMAEIDGREVPFELLHRSGNLWQLLIDGRPWLGVLRTDRRGRHFRIESLCGSELLEVHTDLEASLAPHSQAEDGPRVIRSSMPGVVLDLRVREGQAVSGQDVLLVLEAMKMQNEILAEFAGTVEAIHVEIGAAIAADADLVTIKPNLSSNT